MGGLVWLASYPKSGNTWMRHFLHSLIGASDRSHDINAMTELTTADNGAAWYQPFLDKPVGQCTDEEIAGVRPKALRMIADSAAGLVFVKTHNALVSHLGTAMIEGSVTAGAIYIVRNPLDVAISFARFMATDVDRAIAIMNSNGATVPSREHHAYQYYGSWSEHVLSWTRRPIRQLHVIRYEDMLEAPLDTFGRLAEFLRIGETRRELETAIAASAFERLREQEEEQGFTERPETAERFFREGRAGQWRETLNGAQIDAIVGAHREQMERFGYWPT